MLELLAHRWVAAAIVLIGSIVVGYLLRFVVARRLKALFARTETEVDDLLLAATQRHLLYWCVFAGLVIAARVAPIPEKTVHVVDRIAAVGVVLSLAFAGSSLASRLLARHSRSDEAGVGATSLIQILIRVVIVSLAGILVLQNLGVSVTPIITALGVGSLAVALALQPTLSNLFAGLYLAIGHPIRVGDFVQLEPGVRGMITDIGWRETRIRELAGNVITVPNSRLADMIVTNFTVESPAQGVQVSLAVAYDSDLAHVERAAIEVAREVQSEVEAANREFEPNVRFQTFGESGIQFVVNLQVDDYTARFAVVHEFIKRVKLRFEQEGIVIPYPHRVVQLVSAAEPEAPPAGPPAVPPAAPPARG